MGKAIHRFKTMNEWESFIKGGAVHLDKIAELYLPKQTPIVISQSLFHQIRVMGESFVIVKVKEDSRTEIVLKDNATAIIKQGKVIAKGESVVILCGSSSAQLTNKATCYAFDEAKLTADQSSIAYLYNEAGGIIRGKAIAYLGDYTHGQCEDDGKIIDFGTTGQVSAITPVIDGVAGTRNIQTGGGLLRRKYERKRRVIEGVVLSMDP